jgi:hypothetical protein
MKPNAIDRAMALLEAGHGLDVEDIDALLQEGPLARRPRAELTPQRLLDVVLRLCGTVDVAQVLALLTKEAAGRGVQVPSAAPAGSLPGPRLPPADGGGIWLSPDEADVQHGQVWVVRTVGNGLGWAQIDGYEVERGRKYWRAISLTTRRVVQVKKVLEGSCPRVGGRRERAKR